MGKITKGILGGFSGRVGTVVGSSIFGIDIMRSYQPNVENPRSPGQVSQRTKFSLVVKFLRSFLIIIKIGYALKAIKQSAFNACVSYNVQNAVTGNYPDQTIDYPKLKIAEGSRLIPNSVVIQDSPFSEITINSVVGVSAEEAEYNDLAYALVYNHTKNKFATSMGVNKRSDAEIRITPSDWEEDDVVHAWLFYTSPDGNQISDSVYAGTITLTSA